MLVIAALGLLLGGRSARGQAPGDTVRGVVTDTTKAALFGARVTLVGTSFAAQTRADGRFVFTGVPPGQYTLHAANLGYRPADVPINVSANQAVTIVNVQLSRSAFRLDEQVVVAYGTQRRADLTGSVATISGDEVNQSTVNSVEQGLEGRVAGVNVIESDAAPGGGMLVQIRGMSTLTGVTDPLYVIDGVPFVSNSVDKNSVLIQTDRSTSLGLTDLTTTNPLAELNPADIESVDVLKDASATALYGSRASNGVIIITTKRGKRNQSGQWTFNLQQGYASVAKRLDMLNAFQYATYVNTAYANAGQASAAPYGGRPGSQTPAQIAAKVGNGIDWQDQIFHTAPVTNLQGGVLGGDEKGSYAVSANYLKQSGAIIGSQYDRYGIRVNLDRDVTSFLKVSLSSEVNRTNNNIILTATQTSGNAAGIVRLAINYPPFLPLGDSLNLRTNPQFTDPQFYSMFGANPIDYTDDVPEQQVYTRGLASVRVVADLTHGFSFDASAGANYEAQNYSIYTPSYVQEGGSTNGLGVSANTDFGSIQTEELLRYSHNFGSAHRLDFVGGYSFEYDRNTYTSSTVADFPNDLLGANNLASGSLDYPVNNQFLTWELRSWLGRANYTFLGRYLFTANIRNDCSSKFTANNKCATFPAFAVAWRAVDEPALKSVTALSDLKLRASWGQQGNQAISPFQSQALIGPPQYQVPIGNTIVGAETPIQLASPNLKWETTTQWDVGLDFGLFDQRLTFTGDYYNKRTVDLLQSLTLPDNTGFTAVFFNSGIVTNKGVELGAAVDIFRQQHFLLGDFSWNVSGNASHNVNNVVSLGPISSELGVRLGPGYGATFQPFIFKPGLPLGTLWGYRTGGIFRTQAQVDAYKSIQPNACLGCVKFLDLNHDGTIDEADQTRIGNVLPDWTYGVTNRFRWGKFDLSVLVTIVRGNSIINMDRTVFLEMNGMTNVPKSYVQNAFDPKTNPNGTVPMINLNNGQFSSMSDLFVEDGSYLRLKNVQLGYTFNLPGARTARFYVNGINLLTSTNYSGYDPETAAVGNGIGPDINHMPGVDQGTYPLQRIFTFGVNTTF